MCYFFSSLTFFKLLSETSDVGSDVEGRIFALQEELKRRHREVERLKREAKRRYREKLKVKEQALKKQIEVRFLEYFWLYFKH